MARIVCLEQPRAGVKGALSGVLRLFDEACLLPGASRSIESGAFKNIVVRLDGTEGQLSPEVFPPDWYQGVSAVVVDTADAMRIINDPARRAQAMQKLSEAIPNELADANVQIGPTLEGDAEDKDIGAWTAGFAGVGDCVGLYMATSSHAPEAGLQGFSRSHTLCLLVCKAGAGLAGSSFHSRLTASLAKGASLNSCLCEGSAPGPQALRRVSAAGSRNRGRILLAAAKALGFSTLDTLPDNASAVSAPSRYAVTCIDMNVNSLRELGSGMWQMCSGAVDTSTAKGLLTASNVSDGFVAFVDSNGCFKVNVKNDAFSSVPFASLRLVGNRDAVMTAAKAHKEARGGEAHPDGAFVHSTFCWNDKSATLDSGVEPAVLWGAFESESWTSSWSRELGVAQLRALRLRPELVLLAGSESAKLRAAARFVKT